MKKQHIILTALAAAVLLPSCRVKMYDDKDDEIEISKTLDLKDFNALHISGNIEVEFVQDSVYRVELIGTEKALERALASVEDSTLRIAKKSVSKDWFGTGDKNVLVINVSGRGYTVKVSAPDLQDIQICGSGEVESKMPIRTESFNAFIVGGGDIDLGQVTARHICLSIDGSGCIETTALNADEAEMKISGSGEINTESISCKSCSASIAGSGDIDTAVKGCDTFYASITGSGEIDANLDACGEIEASTTGSGEITLNGNARSLKTSGRGIEANDLVIIK